MLLTEIKNVKNGMILTHDISFGQQLREEFYKKASKDDIWKMQRAIRMADLNEFNYLIKKVLGIEFGSIANKDSTKKDYDIILRNLNEQLSNAIIKEDLEKVNELINKIDKIKKLWESTSDSELNDISLFDFGIGNDIYTKDPLTEKGKEIMKAMKEQYGEEEGEKIFYASKNKGTIEGVD